MAKKKDYLPKRIAGVKVPKAVRRGRLARMLASPLGQEILAEAVVTAGAAAIASQAKEGSPTRRLASGAKRNLAQRADAGLGAGAVLARAIEVAMHTFNDSLGRRLRQDRA